MNSDQLSILMEQLRLKALSCAPEHLDHYYNAYMAANHLWKIAMRLEMIAKAASSIHPN